MVNLKYVQEAYKPEGGRGVNKSVPFVDKSVSM